MTIIKDKVSPFVQAPMDYVRLAPSAASVLSRHRPPRLFINSIGAGIGDDLLCTAMFRELRERGQNDFWITNKHPELFENNDDVSMVLPPLQRYDILLKKFGTEVVYPWYTSYHPAFDRDDPMPEQHLISILCQKAGITGDITLRPYLYLTYEEAQAGRRVDRQIAIQSSGLDATHAMRNKNWVPERYQEVVTALKSKYNFVQVGSPNDPPLEGALDLRGQTSLRGTAAVLHGSLAFIGQVGFLMHLARSVDCRSVIVYGGRETPAQSGYPCNENLYSPVPCSPCWRLNTCPFERMCLQQITVADVIEGLETQVSRNGAPLATDTDTITPELIERNTMRHDAAVLAHQTAWTALYL
jgi:ADP-heptose:LPS heptosyltransferase